ncbi:hypothetical protein FOMG_18200 [Fusarium oxysporum f. sp. melonis 26406]|uniref:Uncharacterized protein n=2 Tax=Fusarium oxysporum TaxID=5507 RepID=W9Z162_FUSOX|nr:hypothetical protein FOVG_19282 [Fusarium oxysporum f. sp. pisi HDV247]EXK25115.1 hypothetical protein FOMG_18200 [Fusarium oxysporum f. sp. melonis 26406]
MEKQPLRCNEETKTEIGTPLSNKVFVIALIPQKDPFVAL